MASVKLLTSNLSALIALSMAVFDSVHFNWTTIPHNSVISIELATLE